MNHSCVSATEDLKYVRFLFPDARHETAVSGSRYGRSTSAARISNPTYKQIKTRQLVKVTLALQSAIYCARSTTVSTWMGYHQGMPHHPAHGMLCLVLRIISDELDVQIAKKSSGVHRHA
jgi:hypothetical protein